MELLSKYPESIANPIRGYVTHTYINNAVSPTVVFSIYVAEIEKTGHGTKPMTNKAMSLVEYM
ncbi:MAG: hypothetical protein ACI358_09205 [Candidatus Limimorpha sp.]